MEIEELLALADNSLQDLHNSSDDMKAEFNNFCSISWTTD